MAINRHWLCIDASHHLVGAWHADHRCICQHMDLVVTDLCLSRQRIAGLAIVTAARLFEFTVIISCPVFNAGGVLCAIAGLGCTGNKPQPHWRTAHVTVFIYRHCLRRCIRLSRAGCIRHKLKTTEQRNRCPVRRLCRHDRRILTGAAGGTGNHSRCFHLACRVGEFLRFLG